MSRGIQKTFPGMSKLEPRKSKQTGLPPAERRDNPEHRIQRELFDFIRRFQHIVPEFRFVSGSMNGARRSPKVAREAEEAGLCRGIWDVHAPGVRVIQGQTCGGAYLETKSKTGRLTPEQEAFRKMFGTQYVFIVYRDWLDGARAICDYYGVTDPRVWDNLKINEKATPKP